MIECNINNERYIGSSMQKNKNQRLHHHKDKNNKCISKQIINRNDYQYIILEDILDIDKKKLRIKEQEYIDKYDCINIRKSYISEEEKNKDYKKKWHQNNKEKIKEKRKDYFKQYRQNNKEKKKQYNKEYNKEYNFFKKYNNVIADYINEINKY